MMYVEFNNGDCELLTSLRKRRVWDHEKNESYHAVIVNDTHIVAAFHSAEARDTIWRLWRNLLEDARFCGLQEANLMFTNSNVAKWQIERCIILTDRGKILEND